MEILHDLSVFVAGFVGSPYAVWFLFIIAFAESSFFPIPPDTLLIPLSLANPPTALFYALVATIASVLGGILGYFIGKFGGRRILDKIAKGEKIELVKHYYNKYDAWAIGVAAFTPIPYKVFTISAGVFDLDFKRFVLMSFIGRGARFFIVGILIWIFGPTIQIFLDNYLELVIVGFTVLLVGGFLLINHLGNKAAKNLADSKNNNNEKPLEKG